MVKSNIIGKPFIKWAGGKKQLIPQMENLLPEHLNDNAFTYIEPFVGGGAMLFYMLEHFPNMTNVVINDINRELIQCYLDIKFSPEILLSELREIEKEYNGLSMVAKKDFFLKMRHDYNLKYCSSIRNSALFIFLNKTCFNGLYRVNRKGEFNVPFGGYEHPKIADEETIVRDSILLQKVQPVSFDFEDTLNYVYDNNVFFYFDPPYRPVSKTSAFTDYTKDGFNDDEQIRLKNFCDKINDKKYLFMLSNSDGYCINPEDVFLRDLYNNYNINTIYASRSINSDGNKRGKVPEIIVRNYQ